jgi:drug/metabolite transporter (DMT)-like permease
MRLGESNLAFSFYGFAASAAISGALLLAHGALALEAGDFLRLALSGLLSGMASICLMTAYHRSPVIMVAPFQYTQIIWGALAGWLLWNQWPGQRLIIGAVIIAISGLFLIYCEMQFTETSKRLSKRR